MHPDALQLLLEKDDITWKGLLYDLVKTEQMNPWNIDVSHLAQRYIETIKEMKKLDFRISGKVLLAAAILLKMKSQYLLDHGIEELDRLLASRNEIENENFFSEFSEDLFQSAQKIEEEHPKLIPRTPQPRHRKITIYDLAEALQKALEVKKRSLSRQFPNIKIEIPKKKYDITQVIREVYTKIKSYFFIDKGKSLRFTQLLPENPKKEDKILTFIPLLHLDNQGKINIWQQEQFGDIEIELRKARKQVDKER